MRLITCSNSGPRLSRGAEGLQVSTAAPGGLVPIVNSLLGETGGHWIYTAESESSGGIMRQSVSDGRDATWEALPISNDLLSQQRESITISTLLWTFHYLHDTSIAPVFSDATETAWTAYREVNRRFGSALAKAHENSREEVVLIHDFHLMLVAAEFSGTVRDRQSKLVYFHHVPWCEPDYFGLIPTGIAREILESLTNCDVVGFHCDRWCDAFLACCAKYLPEAEIVDRTVRFRDRTTIVRSAPGPIDASVLRNLTLSESTQSWRETFLERAAGRQVITRVDRLDLWKNVNRGFNSFDLLLQRRPELASEVWFCALVTLPRFMTERHKAYREICEGIVEQINDKYGNGRGVVSLVYPGANENTRHRAIAALSVGTTTLVNPTFDGLNMVAKEAVIVNPKSRLLLSTNAGVYPQLASFAQPLQPFDIEATAHALESALDGTTDRNEVGSTAVRTLEDETAAGWLGALIGAS